MALLSFKWLNERKFLKVLRNRPKDFFTKVHKYWTLDDQETLASIVREQLSGRQGNMGLNRISGHAANALNVRTYKGKDDVVSRLYLNKSNPAKIYLPIHDESRSGDGVIRAKNKKYLHFKIHTSTRAYTKQGKRLKSSVKQYSWVKVKQVKIPVRTNIIEFFIKDGGKKRRESVYRAMKEVAHG